MTKSRVIPLLLSLLVLSACKPITPPAGTPAENATAQTGGADSNSDANANPEPNAQNGLGDSYYPLEGNGGYDAQHYTIDLTADTQAKTIAGATTIEALATNDLPSFDLDFWGLDVASVTVNGADATFSREGQELVVTPAAPIASGDTFTVSVAYSGVPEPYADPALGMMSATTGWKEWAPGYFAAIGQPDGAMAWFPSNNHPSDKATYTFRITVDDPNVVAASGTLQEVIQVDDNTRTYVWQMPHPMATELAMVAVGEYELSESETPNGVHIRNYFPKGYDQAVIDSFDVTGDMMVFLSDLLGDYPFDAYGAIVVPGFFEGSALETQSLSVFSDSAPEKADELEILHELFHQWYGNTLTVADWRDLWLHEGFSRYMEALWLEKTQGIDAYNQYILEQFNTQLGYGVTLPQMLGQPEQEVGHVIPPYDPGVQLLFVPTYTGGAVALHLLRLEVGDETFFNILRTFYEEHKDVPASTEDFVATAEKLAGRNLDNIWHPWVFGDTVPTTIPLLGQ